MSGKRTSSSGDGRRTSGRGGQRGGLTVRVRSAKGRRGSSTRWLKRQLNDPYVVEAKRLGYRSRSAFKLIELDDRFHFLKPGQRVVDLGAAPGGWTQVAVARCRASKAAPEGASEVSNPTVVALDLLEMEPLVGATTLRLDFLDPAAPGVLHEALGGPVQVVLSDMAAPTTGHPQTDHLRIIELCQLALEFAVSVLEPGGTFVAKVFQGGTEGALLAQIKQRFASVKHAKPPASRKESAEVYLVAQGFRPAKDGVADDNPGGASP